MNNWKLKLKQDFILQYYQIEIYIQKISVKNYSRHFIEMDKLMLKCTLKCQSPLIFNTFLKIIRQLWILDNLISKLNIKLQ